MHHLHLTNTLTHAKAAFEPLNPPFVGVYVCGPTVYGDAHLGHARAYTSFDVLVRWLRHSGYKVRYVRNITDVGHLLGDGEEGEDRILKKARLEQLEPMEVAQHYLDRFHEDMAALNIQRPSIEPRASGHIPEQIAMIEKIIANGFAYVANQSVYLDVAKYRESYPYGELSGRKNLDENQSGTRELDGQSEKRNPNDFALWKRAEPEHLMRWHSPWGEGFPGWHIECSAMSTKYLGTPFDIHGGGLDLMFPHHEAEIAQCNCSTHPHPASNQARWWLHNNMVTVNGQKMGRSLNNFINLRQLFAGDHPLLTRGYSPMAVRFFILQGHYRSTLDFSDTALDAADKGYRRLAGAFHALSKLEPGASTTFDVAAWADTLHAAMNDDLNTAMALAGLFEGARVIHAVASGEASLRADALEAFREAFTTYYSGVLGLTAEGAAGGDSAHLDAALQVLIGLRNDARKSKNFAVSDAIRDQLKAAGIALMDGPDGTRWGLE
jgi:cysteinyl-tRNA synthetase